MFTAFAQRPSKRAVGIVLDHILGIRRENLYKTYISPCGNKTPDKKIESQGSLSIYLCHADSFKVFVLQNMPNMSMNTGQGSSGEDFAHAWLL
jgi:hypothetical protein